MCSRSLAEGLREAAVEERGASGGEAAKNRCLALSRTSLSNAAFLEKLREAVLEAGPRAERARRVCSTDEATVEQIHKTFEMTTLGSESTRELHELLDSVCVIVRASNAIMREQRANAHLPTVFLDLLDRVKTALLAAAKRLDDVDDAGNRLHQNQAEVARISELAGSLRRVYPLIDEEAGWLWSGCLAPPDTFWSKAYATLAAAPPATVTMLEWAEWFVEVHRSQLGTAIPTCDGEEDRGVEAYIEAYSVAARVLREFS